MEGPIRVLHVDDDPSFIDLTATYFDKGSDGVETIAKATRATDALEYLSDEDTPVDCIVSDYALPGMDGLEFLDVVRADHPDLPFMFFTGRGSEEVASKALAGGATDYLQKQRGTDHYQLLSNRIRTAVEQYRNERERRRNERYRQRLYRITSDTARGTEEKLSRLLELGCERFGVENGHVVRIDQGVGRHEIRLAAGSELVETGSVTDLEETYCRKTITSDDILTVYNAPEEGWDGDPAYERWDIGCYIGGRIEVDDGLYGTVCFVNRSPRDRPFTEAERTFMDLVTRWMAQMFEREQHDRELGEYKAVVETVADGVYVLDTDFRFTLVNEGLVELTGYDREALVGSHASLVFDEEAIEAGRRNRERLRDGRRETEQLETVVHTADDGTIPCEIRGRLLADVGTDDWCGTAGVIRDLSDRRRRERELERQNERLEEFATVVSHDLRNPLNVAQLRLDVAREDCDSESLDSARAAVDRSLELVDDLLALAREGDQISDPESVDLADAVEDCWQSVVTGEATLVVESDRTIRAERTRLIQLFENLVRNAVEHGPEDVTVRVGDVADGFYVADDGPGIPEDERDRVFQPGYSTADAGTGFGLNIVREIAIAHDWDITVTESEAGGTRFEITDVEPDE